MLDATFLASSAQAEIAALASHTAVINGARRVPVIFAAAWVDASGVGTVGPVLRAATSDWDDAAEGDVVDLDGETARYAVAEVQPDGAGMILCRLHRSA